MRDEADRALEIRDLLATSPFHAWMGIHAIRIDDGAIDLAMDAADHHLNLQGLLHGGVLATLADTAAGLAVRTLLEPGRSHVTVSLAVQYLRPGAPGRIVGHGSVVRMGRSLAHATADVTDANGKLLTTASATIALGDEATSTRPRSSPSRSEDG